MPESRFGTPKKRSVPTFWGQAGEEGDESSNVVLLGETQWQGRSISQDDVTDVLVQGIGDHEGPPHLRKLCLAALFKVPAARQPRQHKERLEPEHPE